MEQCYMQFDKNIFCESTNAIAVAAATATTVSQAFTNSDVYYLYIIFFFSFRMQRFAYARRSPRWCVFVHQIGCEYEFGSR